MAATAPTGESGAGKSTLLKLMLSVYRPSSGSILITYDDGYTVNAGACSRSLTDKTVVVVTHRREALKFCDRIYEIRDKKVVEI